MLLYKLTKDAEQDLREVARYTLSHWGKKIFKQYRSGLECAFEAIAKGKAQGHAFSNELPDLVVTKYRHHYIFYIERNQSKPIIIGVIHERRDIISRLTERLD